MWVHQIKVPIQAMRLLLSNEEKNSPLNLELFKIEQYVEMVLSCARLESDSTDYVIRSLPLEQIVKPAVRKYAPMFISKKLSLEMSSLTATVLTDEKWAQFIVEQILSNSLKYTRTGSIRIWQKDPAALVIEDTGIGIDPADIPRLGERGFTGYNGRLDKKIHWHRVISVQRDLAQALTHPHHRIGTGQRHTGDHRFCNTPAAGGVMSPVILQNCKVRGRCRKGNPWQRLFSSGTLITERIRRYATWQF